MDVCRIGLLEVGVVLEMGARMLRVRNSCVIIGIPHKKLSVFDKPMIRSNNNNLPLPLYLTDQSHSCK